MFSFFDVWKHQIGKYLSEYIESRREDLAKVNPLGEETARRLSAFSLNGKMIRGCLTCLGHALFRDRVTPDVITAASAMELIQSALLIHDDIMDRDRIRRGNQSIHAQFAQIASKDGISGSEHVGESMGICAGDVSFFLAFELLGELKAPPGVLKRILKLCSHELSYVGIAQMEDVYRGESPKSPSHEDTLRLYLYKTGRYTFAMPILLGGVLAEGEESTLGKLEAIAEDLGIIFQIKDDELGLFGTTDSVGKSIGSDIREGKKTLYYSHLMASAQEAEKTRLAGIFGNPEIEASDVEYVRQLVEDLGIKTRVTEDLLARAERVRSSIGSLQQLHEPYRSVLYEVLEYNLYRQK